MGMSRKRQNSSSSSSSSSSYSSSESLAKQSPTKSRRKKSPQRMRTPERHNNRQTNRRSSPRRQSGGGGGGGGNNRHSFNTPSKYVGADRTGLDSYLAERRRRKEERDAERSSRDKEEKKRKDKKDKDRKMKPDKKDKDEKKADPTAPNYERSGKLAEERNTYKGIVIKYSEPQEARIPKTKWRLYPFKGDETLPTMYIHRNSGYLIGRERKVVDIPADHPSCSSQHAVIQFRLVDHKRSDGTATKKVKPYLMDLESTNGSFLNNVKIEAKRYYELKERDIIKFGFSTREYVILHDSSEGVVDTES